MADMTTIKGKIRDTIYPNGTGAITAEKHQSLLLDVVDNINELKQDTLVSGQNIRPLVSGESLLGSNALAVLGTRFVYELDNQQLFAMIDGALQDFHIWMASRAVQSQVAQVIEIQKEGYFKELVPLTIKNKAGLAALCWEYDGMIYEASMEDNVLTVVSKPKGDEFDKQGNYPLLHVGTADDLAGRGESVSASFGFRASGGKSIKDGRAYIKRIKGNSVVWNQHVDTSNFTTLVSNGVHFEKQADGGIKVYTDEGGATADTNCGYFPSKQGFLGHYCAILGCPQGGSFTSYFINDGSEGFSDKGNGEIRQKTSNNMVVTIGVKQGTIISTPIVFYPQFIDLTQMFQAGNKPSTIGEFNARVATLGVDMNAYNEGQVIHCNTESIKSVGDNAWDEEWENGTFNTTTGDNMNTNVANKSIRCKNPIPVVAGEEYYSNHDMWVIYETSDHAIVQTPTGASSGNSVFVAGRNRFTIPTNVAYMRFYLLSTYGTTYNHDVMISLVHSGWKQDTDAGYQPYWQDTLPLPIIRKYFHDGMKSAGTAHDEIRYNKESGKWEAVKRIGEVDMGSLDWFVDAFNNVPTFRSKSITNGASHNYETIGDALIAMYTQMPSFVFLSSEDKVFTFNSRAHSLNTLAVRDSSFTDVASFKAMLQEKQVVLYYELAEPIVTELDAEDQNFRDYYNVADFGTEQSQSSVPSAPFSADIIYQFNAVDMIREHELEITELQSIIATMQAQLTSLINGGQ